MDYFEIYFDDLTEEAQAELLRFYECDDPSDFNFDVFPITSIPKPEDI